MTSLLNSNGPSRKESKACEADRKVWQEALSLALTVNKDQVAETKRRQFWEDLSKMLAESRLPFFTAEHQSFKTFANKFILNCIMPDSTSLRKTYIPHLYN